MELFLSFVVNQIAIILIQLSYVLPCISLRFVLCASSHRICSGGCTLVSWQVIVTRCSIVSLTYVTTMRPKISIWIQWCKVAARIVLALLVCRSPLLSFCSCMWHCRAHQLARLCFSVEIVSVAVLSSCVSVVLLMDISATACLSTAVDVDKFASASATSTLDRSEERRV